MKLDKEFKNDVKREMKELYDKFNIIPNGGGELINKQTNKHIYNYYSRAATVYYL